MNKNFSNIIKYDLSKITGYFSNKESIDIEKSILIEIEMKKYLYLIVKNKTEYGMTGLVDSYWHTFLLFTKEYHDFCNFLGSTYIHHTPAILEEEKERNHQDFNCMINDYKIEYGMSLPDELWNTSYILKCGGEDNGRPFPYLNKLIRCGGGRIAL